MCASAKNKSKLKSVNQMLPPASQPRLGPGLPSCPRGFPRETAWLTGWDSKPGPDTLPKVCQCPAGTRKHSKPRDNPGQALPGSWPALLPAADLQPRPLKRLWAGFLHAGPTCLLSRGLGWLPCLLNVCTGPWQAQSTRPLTAHPSASDRGWSPGLPSHAS